MAEPFEPDNDDLDLLVCLQHVVEDCPSPKAKGRAQGLLRARQDEMKDGST